MRILVYTSIPRDRTEAQQRAALHAHILCWFRRRRKPNAYVPIPSMKRQAPGVEPRQRPLDQEAQPLPVYQEDAIYHDAHVARVTAELVRPVIRAEDGFKGWSIEKMRVAFLARAVQTRLPYIHNCSSLYCLRSRRKNKHGSVDSRRTAHGSALITARIN